MMLRIATTIALVLSVAGPVHSQQLFPPPESGDYEVTFYGDNSPTYPLRISLNFGRSVIVGNLNGNPVGGMWSWCNGTVHMTFGTVVSHDNITLSGTLKDGMQGPVIRGHWFAVSIGEPTEGAFEAKRLSARE